MSTAAAPPPAHDSTTTTTTPAPADTAQIHTYHCLCTQLLLASTTPLSLLPRRRGDDTAYIVPLPASPPTSTSTSTANTATDASTDADASATTSPHYALPLSLHPDRTALVIQRPDGLEKRYSARCARCRVVVGYWLDWSQFAGAAVAAAAAAGEAVGRGHKARAGRRDDVVYILPGGLLGTEEMAGGGGGGAEGLGHGEVV